MKKQYIYSFLLALVVGAAAFFGGMKYSQGTAQANVFGAGGAGRAGFGGGYGGGSGNGGAVSGSILAKDDKSITVLLRNSAGSKYVFFSPNTSIMKTVNGTTGDLSQGQNVVVTGTTNSDGSVTAQTIQIRQAGSGNGTGGSGGQGSNSQQTTGSQNAGA